MPVMAYDVRHGTIISLPTTASAADLQSEVYAIGKAHGFDNLCDRFGALYAVLLGQAHGPRMGSFIALYGVPETVRLIPHVMSPSVARWR